MSQKVSVSTSLPNMSNTTVDKNTTTCSSSILQNNNNNSKSIFNYQGTSFGTFPSKNTLVSSSSSSCNNEVNISLDDSKCKIIDLYVAATGQ